jgi:hypothetical protein
MAAAARSRSEVFRMVRFVAGVSVRPSRARTALGRRGRVESALPYCLLAILFLFTGASRAWGATWENVLDRYRACRQRQAQVGASVERLGQELEQLSSVAGTAESDAGGEAVAPFLIRLQARADGARDGLRRMPGLLDEIDAQIEQYRDSRTCPECIEASTLLLCATVAELSADVEGCLSSVRALRAHLAGDLPVAPLLRRCRERLTAVSKAFDALGQLGEVEPELRGVGEALDQAGAALGAGRDTGALVRLLEAREALERLAVYLDAPP